MEGTAISREYPLPVISCDEKVIDMPLSELDFHLHLAKMEIGPSENMRQAAAHIRELLGEGIVEFNSRLWMNRFKTPYKSFSDLVYSLRVKKMVTVFYGDELKYRFTAKYLMEPMKEPEARECPYPTMDANSFWMRLALLRKSCSLRMRLIPKTVKAFFDEGKYEFTAREWQSRTGMSPDDYSACMDSMVSKHLIVNMSLYDNSISMYMPPHRFTLRGESFGLAITSAAEYNNPDFWKLIYSMCNSPSRVKYSACRFVRTLLGNGRIDFTVAEMEALMGYTQRESNSVLARLVKNKLISKKRTEYSERWKGSRCTRYRLTAPRNTLTMSNVDGITKRLISEISVPENVVLSADVFWSRVDRMSSSKTVTMRHAAEIVRSMIGNGATVFTRQSWLAYSGMGKGAYANCRNGLCQNGLVYNLTAETREKKNETGVYAFTLKGLDYSAFTALSTHDDLTGAYARMSMQCDNDPELFRPLLERIARFSTFEGFADKIVCFMKCRSSPFTECQWAEATGAISSDEAAYECSALLQMGILKRFEKGQFRSFSFRFETASDLEKLINQNEIHAPRGNGEFWDQLATLEWSKSDLMRKAIAAILELISEGTHSFSADEWVKQTGMTYRQLKDVKRSLLRKGIFIELGERGDKRFWIEYPDR